jgi:hypothetical protein
MKESPFMEKRFAPLGPPTMKKKIESSFEPFQIVGKIGGLEFVTAEQAFQEAAEAARKGEFGKWGKKNDKIRTGLSRLA